MSNSRSSGVFYTYEEMHNVGIGPGSPNSWEQYTRINPVFREALETLYTPAAYKALHYHPSTFKRLLELPGTPSDRIKIFRMDLSGDFVQKISEADRSPYIPIIERARVTMKANHRNILLSLINGRTDDVSIFVNMGFACESAIEWADEPGERAGPPRMMSIGGADPRFRRNVLKGFFPYFSNLSVKLDEIMFFFTHAETDRPALVTGPSSERQAVIGFIRKHGVMQFFDKVCTQCGKTGNDLYKCPCKAVRYCCQECYHAHWPAHKQVCEWRCGRSE